MKTEEKIKKEIIGKLADSAAEKITPIIGPVVNEIIKEMIEKFICDMVKTDEPQNLVKQIIDNDANEKPEHKRKKYTWGVVNGKIVIGGSIKPVILKRYNLTVGEEFDNAEEFFYKTGLGQSTIYGWMHKKWLRIIPK